MLVRDALTERELELVKLAALGMRNRHIGWRVGIAEHTVKRWFVTIFNKTGTWSRLELVMKWVGEQGEAVRGAADHGVSWTMGVGFATYPENRC
jgi:DNA-binding CsgD family transcriptional regulator